MSCRNLIKHHRIQYTIQIVCCILVLTLIFIFDLKGDVKKLVLDEEPILESLFNQIDSTVPFQIIYFFKKDFCYKCVSAELQSGWFDAPVDMKKHFNLSFVTNTKQFSKYLKNIHEGDYEIITLKDDSLSSYSKFLNMAVFLDKRNKTAFQYKPSSNDFSTIYRYFDSVLYHFKEFDLKINKQIRIDSTEIPYYVNQLNVSYDSKNKNIIIYSPKEATVWIYNLLSGLKNKTTLYRSDEIERIKVDSTRYIYNNVLLFENNKIITNALLLSNPLDTISFNRTTRRWRKVDQEIHFISVHNDKLITDSISYHDKQIGTFIKSSNYDIVWGVYYLINKDTIFNKFNLFFINDNRIEYFELPLSYYSGNPEYCCSLDDKLYNINPYGKLISIDSNKKTKIIDLSYYKNQRRTCTFFDGKFFSVSENDGDKSCMLVYNQLGLRCFNFRNSKSNAYYLFLSEEKLIIEISLEQNSSDNWIISYYEY